MGAAFAIQVMSGKENNVKKLMDWAFARNESAMQWIKAVHTFTTSTRRLLGNGKLGKEIKRAIMPGYIFIEMNYKVDRNNQSAYLPAEIWHLIKSVPGVLRQFTGAGQVIGADEFNKMLGIEGPEDVEVSVPVEEKSEALVVERVGNEVRNARHKMNTASTIEDKVRAEKELEQAEKIESEMISKGYKERGSKIENEIHKVQEVKGSNKIISSIKVFLRHKKELVRFPRILLNKIIDQFKFQSKSDFPDSTSIMSCLMDMLQKEVDIN
jgi:transcription antitermination factor NusG